MYSIIPDLCKKYNVDILMFNQMSNKTPFYGDIDPRPFFYEWCHNIGANVIQGAGNDEVLKNYNDISIFKQINVKKYNMVLIDDNFVKGAWGTPIFCREARKNGVIVVASPHGNHEFDKYHVDDKLGDIFDYSFVLGEKERNHLVKNNKKKFLISGGIPSNDILKGYKVSGKNILVVVSYVEKFNSKKENKNGYLPFTEQTFLDSDILNIQKKYNLKIIIKEKSRFKKGLDFSLKHLEKYKGVSVIMDHFDNNQLISEAALLISAPSTLCFKAIQMGIPTILLKNYGMIGNFYDYDGLFEIGRDDMEDMVKKMINKGKDIKFIEDTIAGGTHFCSTNLYLNSINKIIEGIF